MENNSIVFNDNVKPVEFSSGSPVSPAPSPKPKNPLVLPLILISLLALVGIGFGVFEFLDNSKKSSELANLKETKSSETKTETPEKTDNVASSEISETKSFSLETNPVYDGSQSASAYNSNSGEISVSIYNEKDSQEISCFNIKRENASDSSSKVVSNDSCDFVGLEGRISKILAGEKGKQSIFDSAVVFLMENGEVYYSNTSEQKDSYSVSKFESGKKAIDVIHANHNFVVRFNDNTFEYIK